MRKVLSLAFAVVLGACVFLEIAIPHIYPARRAVTASLESVVPVEFRGWTVTSLPIAATESLQFHVNKVLRYDEAVQRMYRRGQTEILVYASYWQPGKASYSEVGAHTPDTCWVVAGWTRRERRHSVALATAGQALLPAEVGTFQKDGTVQNVMFWHLVGGKPISFDQVGWDESWTAKIKRGLSFATDFWHFGFDQRSDQCFVRVSFNQPIADALKDEEVGELLRRLAPLGIFATGRAGL